MNRALFFLSFLPALFFCSQKANAQAVIIAGPLLGQMSSCQGAQSENQAFQYFLLQGYNLTGPVTLQSSIGFVVSADENSGFQSSLSLTGKRGAIVDTVYIRLSASAQAGTITGTVTLATAGVPPQTLAVNGTVLAMPTAIAEPNITVLNGNTLPRLNFEGANSNMYMWTNNIPGIGLPANGIDSLPSFRVLSNSDTSVTATITVTPVLAGTAYVTNNAAGTVSVINTLTNTLDTTLSSAGKDPTSEILSPDGGRLYVLNFDSQTIAVINTLTNKLVSVFSLPQKPNPPHYPYQAALSHDGSQLYVLDFGAALIYILDAQTGNLISEETVSGIAQSEIAFNPDGNLFYVGADIGTNQGIQGGLIAFNAGSNTPISSTLLPITYPFVPKHPPPITYINMVFSPDSTRIYTANGTSVVVVNTQTQTVVATLATGYVGMGNAIAVAISPDGRRLYVIVDGIGTQSAVQVFDTATNALLQTISFVQGNLSGLCISPDGSRLYVSITGTNNIAVINTETNAITNLIPVGNTPEINTFCVKSGGCFGTPITFTITVNPAPVPSIFLSTDTLTTLTTVYGMASLSDSFTVSGNLLRAPIILTAPKYFEISLDNNTFSSTLTINASGTLPATTVYVRLAATDLVGAYSSNIQLASAGAGTTDVFIPKSTVTPAGLTITVNNKTKVLDAPNPALTATYQGFEDGDTPASLVYPPALNTTALTNSPVGVYPITASNAYSPNYSISYLQGTLTITPDIIIPNAFTPNGDGINDTWDIQKIGNYPNCAVQVFSRYGSLVYSSTGYNIPWDGSFKGSQLPAGTYYYIINLYSGIPSLSGFVTIIR